VLVTILIKLYPNCFRPAHREREAFQTTWGAVRQPRGSLVVVLVIEAAADPGEGPRVPLFVPLLDPIAGADGLRELAKGLALVLVVRLLRAHQPLVVAVPAVQGLVRRGEALVAGRRANRLNLAQPRLLLGVELGRLRCEDLKRQKATDKANEAILLLQGKAP
jgi:hypothetical protein